MMYLPSYYQDESGSLIIQLSDKDFSKITHLSHHGPYVNKDGSFNYSPTHYSDLKGEKAVELAHSHNIPILLCIVSWKEYLVTINDETSRTNLIINTLRLLDKVGYDGVDVDLEPVIHPGMPEITDHNPDYVLFVKQLYDSLQVRKSSLLGRKPLLTTAVNGIAGLALIQIHDLYDQINLMTYDMSQPWEGWPVWHDAAIYDRGYPFPDDGDLHSPSVELDVKKCTDQGIPRHKIGIGVSGDAFQWKGGTGTPDGGATEPLQHLSTPSSWKRFGYKDMMANHFRLEYYRWDDEAKMSYLSIDNPGSENDEFWSFNDEKSCIEKMNYVQKNKLGGVIIWEIGNAYIKNATEENHLPILDALFRAKAKMKDPDNATE
jgi:chitinase